LIRYLSQEGQIGKAAFKIMEETDQGIHTIWIPAATLVEILYLSEKNRIPLSFQEVKRRIDGADNYKIVDLGFEIIELAGAIKGLETFDRLIVATAKYLGLPILTSDKEIKDRSGIEVIWD
jgi:predicted nucleic acid-binding protein